MSPATNLDYAIPVRVSEDVHKDIVRFARMENRTLTGWTRDRLYRAVDEMRQTIVTPANESGHEADHGRT